MRGKAKFTVNKCRILQMEDSDIRRFFTVNLAFTLTSGAALTPSCSPQTAAIPMRAFPMLGEADVLDSRLSSRPSLDPARHETALDLPSTSTQQNDIDPAATSSATVTPGQARDRSQNSPKGPNLIEFPISFKLCEVDCSIRLMF